MPSKDRIDPKANQWLRSGQEKRSATTPRAHGATGSRTGLSAPILRLARRLGKRPEELVENIPADTLRRLKYPVIEKVEPDGTRSYSHDRQVSEGVISLPQK